ncbi:hypothetical protein RZE82_00790 [Mollicutes bacterium LVI A0039]|nr:hypothetical protein RZE82_00790 [Mollicutes bacterium LVI A0039]
MKFIKGVLLVIILVFIVLTGIKLKNNNEVNVLMDTLVSGKYDIVLSNYQMSSPYKYESVFIDVETKEQKILKHDTYNQIHKVNDGYVLANWLYWENPMHVTETEQTEITLPEELRDIAGGVEQVIDTQFGTILIIPNYVQNLDEFTSTIYNVDTGNYQLIPAGLPTCSFDQVNLYCADFESETSIYDVEANQIIGTIGKDENEEAIVENHKTHDNIAILSTSYDGQAQIKVDNNEIINYDKQVVDVDSCFGNFYILDEFENISISNEFDSYTINPFDYNQMTNMVNMTCSDSEFIISLLNGYDNYSTVLIVSENGIQVIDVDHNMGQQIGVTSLH